MQSQQQTPETVSKRPKRPFNKSKADRRVFLLLAVLSIVGGISGVILAWTAFLSFNGEKVATSTVDAIETDNASSLPPLEATGSLSAPLPQLQGLSANDSVLSSKVFSVPVAGTAQSYNESGELIDYTGVDPLISQSKQGLDDRSGYFYPCVYGLDNFNVCQRKLTKEEATGKGY